MIKRAYEPLDRIVNPGKVLVIYGPRRVGKTTLLDQFLRSTQFKYKLASGDDIRAQHILGSQDFQQILAYVEGYDLFALDEAQQIPNIGMGLKIIVDQNPGMRVIVTGSSSFELAGQIGEPLTGRKRTLCLYPLAQCELIKSKNRFELHAKLSDFLIYGSYPDVIQAESYREKRLVLEELANSYLLKDILSYDRIRNSRMLLELLQMLAYQVGNEVSLNELGGKIGIDLKTVQRYLDILEKAFVIQRLGGFSRNLRDEVTTKAKYYFYDTGIRNALISQFNPLDQRQDTGALWENFIFMERLKLRSYQDILANAYFWHTYRDQEIDLIEDRDGTLHAYEMKWSEKKCPGPPHKWSTAYSDAEYHCIHPGNYFDFILPSPNQSTPSE